LIAMNNNRQQSFKVLINHFFGGSY